MALESADIDQEQMVIAVARSEVAASHREFRGANCPGHGDHRAIDHLETGTGIGRGSSRGVASSETEDRFDERLQQSIGGRPLVELHKVQPPLADFSILISVCKITRAALTTADCRRAQDAAPGPRRIL